MNYKYNNGNIVSNNDNHNRRSYWLTKIGYWMKEINVLINLNNTSVTTDWNKIGHWIQKRGCYWKWLMRQEKKEEMQFDS